MAIVPFKNQDDSRVQQTRSHIVLEKALPYEGSDQNLPVAFVVERSIRVKLQRRR